MPSGQHGLPLERFYRGQPGMARHLPQERGQEDDEPETDEGTAVFAEGDTVPVSGFGLAQKKTVPRPLYTEATLLAAMETCGREIADEQAREAVKELGIGTPATRAAIITTLFKRDYIARSGKSIVPTEKGLPYLRCGEGHARGGCFP